MPWCCKRRIHFARYFEEYFTIIIFQNPAVSKNSVPWGCDGMYLCTRCRADSFDGLPKKKRRTWSRGKFCWPGTCSSANATVSTCSHTRPFSSKSCRMCGTDACLRVRSMPFRTGNTENINVKKLIIYNDIFIGDMRLTPIDLWD